MGEMHVFYNEFHWHLVNNFLSSSVNDPGDGSCWRYNKMAVRLVETDGRIDVQAAMQLLAGKEL